MSTAPIKQGPVDVDVRQAAAEQLGSAMAAETDNILREAVTRFFGRDDWTLGELKGRGVVQHLPSGVEVFYLDGVALVELYRVTVECENKGGKVVASAKRNYRFLEPNANNDASAT